MDNSSPASICAACGAANRCALARGEAAATCWCTRVAVQLPLPTETDSGCYCYSCLQKLTAQPATKHWEPSRER